MRNDEHDAMDRRLGSIFRQGIEPLGGDAFRIGVMQRIEKRARLRKFVVASSIAAGALIAVVPAYELSLAFSNGLTELTAQLDGLGWQPNHRVISIIAISALVGPLLANLLED